MFGKSKRLGLVIILMAALVFMGINFLKAKKPVPWVWEVTLPDSAQSYNLYGYGGVTYYDGDYTHVWVEEAKSYIGPRANKFILLIENTEANPDKVGFKNLNLDLTRTPEWPHCIFPICSVSDCFNVETCCMECFLEENPHPSWDYAYFYMVIEFNFDFEDMGESSGESVFGIARIGVVNTDECLADDELNVVYHNVSCWPYDPKQGSWGCYIYIQRVDENTWTISADITILHVFEQYMVYLGGSRGKGGKGKGPADEKLPLRTTTSFKFTTTWTRSLPTR